MKRDGGRETRDEGHRTGDEKVFASIVPANEVSGRPSSVALPSKGWGILFGVPALFLTAYFYPTIPILSGFTLCSVRRLTSIACPGCGLKSSFIALTHLNLRESIDAHPLGVVIAGWLLYIMIRELSALSLGRRPGPLLKQRQRDWLLYAFLAVLMFNWLLGLSLRYLALT